MKLIKLVELMNGAKRWQSRTEIPIELANDDEYIENLKFELKERCVKEYVRVVDDSFKYSISTDRVSPIAVITLEIEDLFGLKDQNKKLHIELKELVDKYKALINKEIQNK